MKIQHDTVIDMLVDFSHQGAKREEILLDKIVELNRHTRRHDHAIWLDTTLIFSVERKYSQLNVEDKRKGLELLENWLESEKNKLNKVT